MRNNQIIEGQFLPGNQRFPDGLVAVPLVQLKDIYERLQRLTELGRCPVSAWLEMPRKEEQLRHAVFANAEFGAVYAGQWLTRATKQKDEGL